MWGTQKQMSIESVFKTILKKSFICCHPAQSFECGSVGRHFFVLQTELNWRDFKYELKKGMPFIPVHSPFSSSSIYYSTFSAFLKGNTEEI